MNNLNFTLGVVFSFLLSLNQDSIAGELIPAGKSASPSQSSAINQPYWASKNLGHQKCVVLKKDGAIVELPPTTAVAECPALLEYDSRFRSDSPGIVKNFAIGNLKANYIIGPKVKTYDAAVKSCNSLDPSRSFQLIDPGLFVGIMMGGQNPFSQVPKLSGQGFIHLTWPKNDILAGTDKVLALVDGNETDDEIFELEKLVDTIKKDAPTNLNKDQKEKLAQIEEVAKSGIHAICVQDLSKKRTF